jgi:hypothetical protein
VPPQLWRREKDQQDQTADRRRCPGLLLTVLATAAAVQDRDAAKPLLWNLRQAFPSIKVPGPTAAMPASSSPVPKSRIALALEIVKRPDDPHSFKGLPRRWVVQQTLAWITRSAPSETTSGRPATTKSTPTGPRSSS